MNDHFADLTIAVVGATGVVGETMLECLSERIVPSTKVVALASARSAGEVVQCGRRSLTVRDLDEHDFKSTHIALFSAGGDVSRQYAPIAAAAGCVVIDNSSAFRMDPDCPLVVDEVNPHALSMLNQQRRIVANPNCSTMQLMVALAPIHALSPIRRVNVATYQSVSGAGRAAVEELAHQTAGLLRFESIETKALPAQIAFNVLPQIDVLDANGYSREELKLLNETQKILEDDQIMVNATAVRVPVFYGHSEAVHLETAEPLALEAVATALRTAAGVRLVEAAQAADWPTPVTHAAGNDLTYVGRLRRDLSHPNGINLWVVSDNVRKGAATNAVQIAERLVNFHLSSIVVCDS